MPGIPITRLAAVTTVAMALGLVAAPSAVASGHRDPIRVQESKSRIKATGPGFTLKLSTRGIDVRVDEDEFGDPASGHPIVRQTIDLAGRTLRPFECRNGTYTIKAGTFDRTWRYSSLKPRPLPYTPEFAAAFPGLYGPFVGEIDGTVTDAKGETLRVLISDLSYEVFTERGLSTTNPIHGLFVDRHGKVRDRISLFGRFRSGPNGENAVHGIVDRGTCRQVVDLPFGPGSAGAIGTGPLFVMPFSTRVTVPRDH